ncbi:MAG: sel1 repeat family protein, partial [Lachnospiraceae bacterium]|nr:sel1 repeat family protein [Lachnospiraceae bacterium]
MNTKDIGEQINFQTVMKSAKLGSADSMFLLGSFYFEGHGTKQNMDLAKKWWRKAAKAGNMYAQYNTALMYLNGDGVKKS